MNNQHLIDIDTEKVVISSIIENNDLFYILPLNSSLFSAIENQELYNIISELLKNNSVVDSVILLSTFRKLNKIQLKDYFDKNFYNKGISISYKNYEAYVKILLDLSIKRDFIYNFQKIVNTAQIPTETIYDIREKSLKEFNDLFIERLNSTENKSNEFPILLKDVETKFCQITAGGITGIPSSLNVINKALGGWQPTNLTIIAARPGMGKSAFMVQQIIDVAMSNMSVGVFSLEMSASQIASRIVSNYTGIPNSSILRKGLKDDEIDKYVSLKDDLVNFQIHIDDTPNIPLSSLRMKAKMMKMKYDINILFVDYLQLISNEKKQNREQEISSISRMLKGIAKELDIPVIALAQLSRAVENRNDKRPILSDLRDSGGIEQDADEVIFLYRPYAYGIENWSQINLYEGATKDEAEIIIAKNRHGGIISERCKVDLATSHFFEII